MIPVFDLHCDTPLNIKKKRFNHVQPAILKPAIFSGVIFAHFVYPKQKQPFDVSIRLLLSTINFLKDKKNINIVYDFNKIDLSKTNIILGVEGGHIFDENFCQFETLYELGARVFTLTWNNSNRFAHSAFDNDKKGLTKRGKEFVKLLKNYDIVLDLSHSSTRTVLDICKISENPVFASHSCIRALNPFIRNIDDQAIRAIISLQGIVAINFSRKHLGNYMVVDHINYLCDNFGIDSIGIGSDFDGINDPIYGCPSGYKILLNDLIKAGYTRKMVEKIFFKNFLNLLR
ncbi:MAG: membrane dipeptidase [candidate division WOR-3 bacterium]